MGEENCVTQRWNMRQLIIRGVANRVEGRGMENQLDSFITGKHERPGGED